MPCPQCGAWTDIIDSRSPAPLVKRRRYRCANMHTFITISEEVFIGMIEDGKLKETNEQKSKNRINETNDP